jgi:hypothetical protein
MKTKWVLLVFVQVVIATTCTAAQQCTNVTSMTLPDVTKYLSNVDSSDQRNADCVISALHRLKDLGTPDAISLLVKYLDFKRPLTTPEQQGFYLHAPSISSLYPATDLLFAVGKRSVDPLLHAIAHPLTDQQHANAIYTLMLVFRDKAPDGVRAIVQASRSGVDNAGSSNLLRAARRAAQLCVPEQRHECEAAAKQ